MAARIATACERKSRPLSLRQTKTCRSSSVLRRRTSTIASMAGHAVYDLTLFVLIRAGV